MSGSPAEPPPQAERRRGAGPTADQLVRSCAAPRCPTCSCTRADALASLAFGKLAPDLRDLEQARLAIDALKALGPLLDEGPRRDIQQVVANLQLAYVEAAAPKAAESRLPAAM